MTEPPATLTPAPAEVNGPPAADADARLARIEAALAVLAAQQAAGPPPEGYARPSAGSQALATLSTAVQVAQATGQLPGGAKARRAWLKWPIVRECVMVTKLYLDKRYSPTRAAQLGVPAILILLVLNALLFRFGFTFPVLAQILEYLVVMLLAVVLYRILAAEVTRYAAVLDYLARSGRG